MLTIFGFAAQAQCVANFTSSQLNCPTVDFTDGSVAVLATVDSWAWDFGDGTTDTVQNPSHTYASNGTYPVQLVITASNGCTDTVVNNVDVTCIPEPTCEAKFDFIKDNCPDIIFTDSSTTAPTDSIVSWTWSFGDGDSSATQSPIHTYTYNDDFVVSLTILTADSCESTFVDTISLTCVPPPPCRSDFDFTVSNCSEFSFTNRAQSSGTITNYEWLFGDGTLSTDPNPTHIYTQNGDYQVCLKVIADNGCEETYCDSISISCLPPPACMAEFTTNTAGCPEIAFFDLSKDKGINFWNWDFGDGNTSNLQNPSNTYANGGNYQVCLTINTDSCSSTTCQIVNVACLSLADEEAIEIKIYPNPAQDILNLSISQELKDAEVKIYSIQGQLMLTENISVVNQKAINISDLPAGMFIIEIEEAGSVFARQQFIKSE